jgi:hypothetical protein
MSGIFIIVDAREGLFSPVTGTPGVVVRSLVPGAEVGASVALGASVPVDSTVTGGTFVLGILVVVS